MLPCLLAIALSQTAPTATQWKHGDVLVTVQPERREWKISRGTGNGVTFFGYDSIDRIESIPNQLTVRASGPQGGETIVIRPAGSSSVRVQASWYSIPSGGASTFLEQFRLDPAFGKATDPPGLADTWRSPVVSASDGKTLVWIMPTFDEPQPLNSFARYFGTGAIGRANARFVAGQGLELNGTPVQLDKPALGLGYGDSDFYVTFANSVNPTADRMRALDDLFMRTANARKFRAYPQKAPYNIAAYTTYGFRQQVVVDPADPAFESELKPTLWQTTQKGSITLGRPVGQDHVELGTVANAMRAAWAMKDWGTTHKQGRWTGYADQLARTVLDQTGNANVETSAAEAATAFYALRWIESYPDDPVAKELLPHVNRTLRRLPNLITEPASAALYTAAQASGRFSQDAGNDRKINRDLLFSTRKDDPWTLEYACQIASKADAKTRGQIEELVAYHAEHQIAFDRGDLDRLSFFGAFANEQGEYGPTSALTASAIGRLGVIFKKPVWIERGAWGLRAGNNLMTSNAAGGEPDAFPLLPTGQAYPGFGNVRANMPDPRTSFEGAEGLYLAAVWDLLRVTGGLYFVDDRNAVGVDGLFVEDGKLYNAFFSNPRPFLKEYQEPTRSAQNANRRDPKSALAWPMISHFEIQKRGDSFVAVAAPGFDFPGAPNFGSFEFTPRPLSLGETLVQAEIGASGWEAVLSDAVLEQPALRFRPSSPTWMESRAVLPAGWPLRGVKHFPIGWARYGDLRWTDPLSTATGDEINSGAIGSLESPAFSSEGQGIQFTVTAQGDCSVEVRLERAGTQIAEWHPVLPVANQAVKLELPILTDDRYVIEVFDRDPRGFIRVDGIKLIP